MRFACRFRGLRARLRRVWSFQRLGNCDAIGYERFYEHAAAPLAAGAGAVLSGSGFVAAHAQESALDVEDPISEGIMTTATAYLGGCPGAFTDPPTLCAMGSDGADGSLDRRQAGVIRQ